MDEQGRELMGNVISSNSLAQPTRNRKGHLGITTFLPDADFKAALDITHAYGVQLRFLSTCSGSRRMSGTSLEIILAWTRQYEVSEDSLHASHGGRTRGMIFVPVMP